MVARPSFCVMALAVVTACSAEVVDEGDLGDPAESATQAHVRLERIDGAAGLRTRVSAHFMRVRGVGKLAAQRVVVTRPSFPRALGCSWRSGAPPWSDGVVSGSIELFDVGDVVVRWDESTRLLAARAFPDVGEIVSGIVYTSRDDSGGLPPSTRYRFETTGSSVVDGFAIQADAPAPPSGIRVGSVPLTEGDGPLPVSVGSRIRIGWDASEGAADYLGVGLSAGGHRVECTFADRGTGEVPARFNVWDEGSLIDLTIHRLRRVTVRDASSSIDEAIVDFDFSVGAQGVMTE